MALHKDTVSNPSAGTSEEGPCGDDVNGSHNR